MTISNDIVISEAERNAIRRAFILTNFTAGQLAKADDLEGDEFESLAAILDMLAEELGRMEGRLLAP